MCYKLRKFLESAAPLGWDGSVLNVLTEEFKVSRETDGS